MTNNTLNGSIHAKPIKGSLKFTKTVSSQLLLSTDLQILLTRHHSVENSYAQD